MWYTTAFFILIALSAWLRCSQRFKDEGERWKVTKDTGILLAFLGLATATLFIAVISWQSPQLTIETFIGKVLIPPNLTLGSLTLVIGGAALALSTWNPDRKKLLYKQVYRLILISIMGFTPYIMWFSVRFIHLELAFAASIGLSCFIISLILLFVNLGKVRIRLPMKPSAEGKKNV